MTRKIALLSDEAINQIAAGEVVENPASVVKELVDNALDAGSSSIYIEIQAGGHLLILIEDDGCGMSSEDVKLSLLRHATSKIKEVSDLDRLSTMGFRGEALAAIASVSKLEIRTSDGEESTRISVEGGRFETIETCARNRGTTIEVRSLFYNAPARRKFQKSPQASTAAIVRVVESLSIAHSEVAFSLRSQGELLLDVKPSSLKERIEEILGREYALGTWFDEEKIKGMLGRPEDAKATRSGQFFFLNRRPIVSPLLSRALRDGYGTRIGTGEHPPAILFFELDPTEFDVNVHPQKREVRFRRESALFSETLRTVQRSFLPQSEIPRSFIFSSEGAASSFFSREEPNFLESRTFECQRDFLPHEPDDRPLAVLGTFLLLERQGKIYVVDLGGVSEERALSIQEKQSLLFPLEYALSLEESQMAGELLEHLAKAGLDARMVGPKHLCIDAIPDWIDTGKVLPLFSALKEDLLKGVPVEATLKRLVRCGFSKGFSLEEAAALWRQRRALRQICLESSDLERLFG